MSHYQYRNPTRWALSSGSVFLPVESLIDPPHPPVLHCPVCRLACTKRFHTAWSSSLSGVTAREPPSVTFSTIMAWGEVEQHRTSPYQVSWPCALPSGSPRQSFSCLNGRYSTQLLHAVPYRSTILAHSTWMHPAVISSWLWIRGAQDRTL